jgi:hypothetical protein
VWAWSPADTCSSAAADLESKGGNSLWAVRIPLEHARFEGVFEEFPWDGLRGVVWAEPK